MKSKATLLILLGVALAIGSLRAQEIEESVSGMSVGSNNGFSIEFPDYDSKFLNSVWRDYLKSFKGKTKKVKRSKEFFTDDANIGYISSNTVDIYHLVESAGSGSRLRVWMDLGGAFLDSESHADAYEGFAMFVQGLDKQLNVENIKLELKDEESELKSLERNLAKLQKLNDRYHKEIEDWKRKIEENEQKIETNITDQADVTNSIEAQKEKVRLVEVKLAKAES